MQNAPEPVREVWLRNAEALLTLNWRSEFTESDDAVLMKLRFAQFLSAGADNIPFERISPNVSIASNVGAFAAPMAEHVLAMTLALAKRLILQNQQLAQGVFDQTTPSLALDGSRVWDHRLRWHRNRLRSALPRARVTDPRDQHVRRHR